MLQKCNKNYLFFELINIFDAKLAKNINLLAVFN